MTAPPSIDIDVADVTKTITGIVRAELRRDIDPSDDVRDIDPSDDVFDHGVTSIAFLRIIAKVDETYDIAVDVAELEVASAGALADLVAKQIHATGQ